MHKIIVTNKTDHIKRHPAIDVGNAGFVVLEENRDSFSVREYLAGILRMREITKREMTDTIGASFKAEFSKAMRELNRDNGSLWWWAMSFTNKLPLMSRLYENAFHFAAIKKILSDRANMTLIVVSDNDILSGQIAVWARSKGVGFESAISAPFAFKKLLKKYTPFMLIYMFIKILARKAVSNALLERIPAVNDEKAVIITQFEPRCIGKDGIFRDINLGEIKRLLADFQSMKKLSFITIGFSPYSFMDFIIKLSKRKDNKGIYPDERFLPIKDLAVIFLESLSKFFRPPEFTGDFSIFGEDVSNLVKSEIKESISSGQMILSLSVHAALSSFSKKYRCRIVYYPFENRSWEKMIVLAFRKNSPTTKIVGHQHTIITQKHLNFFMEESEVCEIPMPDRIVTDGIVTNGIMKRWNFPEDILKIGCALRFSMPAESGCGSRRRGIKDILIVLASGVNEYVRMMVFLEEAFKNENGYKITLRPHPAIPFDNALRIFTPKGFKYNLSHSSLNDDLYNCDVVIYASSTVSLEAISIGKPVICVELDDFLNPDPMFDTELLKWSCRYPEELIKVIDAVSNTDADDIAKMRKSAREYTEKYFCPINRENLAEFLV